LGNVKALEDNDATGAGAAVPVPVSVALCGEPVALSVMLMEAAYVDVEAGVKVSERVQVEEAARVVPQVVVSAKSEGLAPPSTMALMVRLALPMLERVRVWVSAVVPTLVVGNASAEGDREAMGTGAAVPVPLRATVWMEVAALSMRLSDAVRVVAESGVNVIAIAQDDREASIAPQVLVVMAKSVELTPAIEMALILSVAVPGFESVTV